MGPRGDMGGGEYGMAGPMSSGVGVGPRMGPGPGPQMGRGGGGGGGMYEVVEQDLGDGNVYHVQFKRSARNFLLGKTCQRDLQVKRYKRFAVRVHVKHMDVCTGEEEVLYLVKARKLCARAE